MKKNYLFKWFLIFVLIILCIDLVFNFSDILEENFTDQLGEAAKSWDSNDPTTHITPSTDQKIRSIVSKYSGKIINIDPIGDAPTEKVLIHFYGSSALTMNDDGTYSITIRNKDSIRQQWEIKAINTRVQYEEIIPTSNKTMGYNLDDVKYPFYIVRSVHKPDKALQYDSGSILVRPLANYDSQKWDISYTKIESNEAIRTHKYDPMSILSSDFRTDPQIASANEYSVDKDKIKINLNLDNSTLGSILNKYEPGKLSGNTQTGENPLSNTPTDCDETKWLNRDSIKSVCSGCDPDSIDPV
jgi:hypothetical protein